MGASPSLLAGSGAPEASGHQGERLSPDSCDLRCGPDLADLGQIQAERLDGDLRGYAAQLGLEVAAFDRDKASVAVLARIRRDVDSGLASGQVLGTPTLFIDGVLHRGGYDPPTLLAALDVLAS
jgi:hypothetical protein